MKYIVCLTIAFLASCSSLPREKSPGQNFLSPTRWTRELKLKQHVSSRSERYVGSQGSGMYVVIEPGVAQARVGRRVISLGSEPRLWQGAIYLPKSAVAIIKRNLGTIKKAPITTQHLEWNPPTKDRVWNYIVVHHSDTSTGSAAVFHKHHVEVNGWDELGYHFVIGNGSDSGLGQVEIGPRWTKQKHGAHAKTPDNKYNDQGIGICLVGDFCDGEVPSETQMNALISLVRYMQKRYNIPKKHVLRHGDVKPTNCPGEYFPWHEFKSKILP